MLEYGLVTALREATEFNLGQLRELERQVSSSKTDEVENLRIKAMALYYSRNDAQAVRALNVLCMVAKDADAFASLAQALARTGDFERAKEAAMRALELDEKFVAAHQVMAASHIALGEKSAAAEAAAKLLELDGGDRRNVALASAAGVTEPSRWSASIVEELTDFPGMSDDAENLMQTGVLLAADPML